MLSQCRVAALAAAVIALSAGGARAQGTVKIGVVDQFSGPFADFGQQIGNGIETYIREHGDTVAGKKIEIIKRDQGGPNPDRAKQVVQELITRDKVDFLAGIDFSPTAFAMAPLITEAKKPTVIMNAATLSITDSSPYFVRFASTLEALESKLGEWAAKNGIRQSYVVVSDYVAGHAAGDAFKKAFTANGGKIVGETGVPLEGLDFAAYVQRIADAKPESIFVFLASTKQSEQFVRLYVQTGLKAAGTKILGATDLFPQSPALAKAASDDAIGAYSVQNYSWSLDRPLNKKYVADYAKYFGTELHPDFMSVSGYDGMAGIYRVIEKLGGVIDPDKAMAAFKGLAFESPRGPIRIDPDTREVVQPIYIRQIVRENGELVNKEIYTFPEVYNHLNK
ncbi:MAG TPA: ABC transporter substrate-binding protein [Stellaceae bacterium]|nr:ABC transporter substrate-binding protein [Stellaceae bacterium]